MPDLPHSLTPQDCLVLVMIATSASDAEMRTSELITIQSIVGYLPIFDGYDIDRMHTVGQIVFDLFDNEEGVAALFGLVRENLPQELHETAYALACDVGAADGILGQSELRFLQEMRYELNIGRLDAAAIEVGARARFKML